MSIGDESKDSINYFEMKTYSTHIKTEDVKRKKIFFITWRQNYHYDDMTL